MPFFRSHGGWEGHVLLCLCASLLMTLTVGAKPDPWPCDKRFGERCVPYSEMSTCTNVLIKEWSYCKEIDHFCCKDWTTDERFIRKPDRATIMLFKDDFQDNSIFG